MTIRRQHLDLQQHRKRVPYDLAACWYDTVNSYLVRSSQNALVQTLSGILSWAIAIVLFRVYEGENLAAKPRPRAETARDLAGSSAR